MGGGNSRKYQEPVEELHESIFGAYAITSYPGVNYQQNRRPALTRSSLLAI